MSSGTSKEIVHSPIHYRKLIKIIASGCLDLPLYPCRHVAWLWKKPGGCGALMRSSLIMRRLLSPISDFVSSFLGKGFRTVGGWGGLSSMANPIGLLSRGKLGLARTITFTSLECVVLERFIFVCKRGTESKRRHTCVGAANVPLGNRYLYGTYLCTVPP